MPESTARRIAELLLADHTSDEFIEVDFMDPNFSELMFCTLASLGYLVEKTGNGTRFRVKVQSPGLTANA